MSWRLMAALVAALGVAACGGNPLGNEPECGGNPLDGECPDTGGGGDGDGGDGDGDGGGGTTEPTIPAALKGNLDSVSYDPAAGTLTAVIDPLDASPVTVTFVRNAALDTPGYQAFTFQETSSNRIFLALMRSSSDGAVSGGVVGSGQFTEMVWGSDYAANTDFQAPASGGLANYAGRYVGILNSGVAVPGPGAPFDPARPLRVEGDVLVNADFTNNSVEGGIRNRMITETATPMENLFLQITEITTDGTFGGTVVYGDQQAAGTYGGTFGGDGGTAVAGTIEVKPDSSDADLLERGVFVADKCVPGDAPPCP